MVGAKPVALADRPALVLRRWRDCLSIGYNLNVRAVHSEIGNQIVFDCFRYRSDISAEEGRRWPSVQERYMRRVEEIDSRG